MAHSPAESQRVSFISSDKGFLKKVIQKTEAGEIWMGHHDADTPKPRLRMEGTGTQQEQVRKTDLLQRARNPESALGGLEVQTETRLTRLTSGLQSLSKVSQLHSENKECF